MNFVNFSHSPLFPSVSQDYRWVEGEGYSFCIEEYSDEEYHVYEVPEGQEVIFAMPDLTGYRTEWHGFAPHAITFWIPDDAIVCVGTAECPEQLCQAGDVGRVLKEIRKRYPDRRGPMIYRSWEVAMPARVVAQSCLAIAQMRNYVASRRKRT